MLPGPESKYFKLSEKSTENRVRSTQLCDLSPRNNLKRGPTAFCATRGRLSEARPRRTCGPWAWAGAGALLVLFQRPRESGSGRERTNAVGRKGSARPPAAHIGESGRAKRTPCMVLTTAEESEFVSTSIPPVKIKYRARVKICSEFCYRCGCAEFK